jgi:hypothetical protein
MERYSLDDEGLEPDVKGPWVYFHEHKILVDEIAASRDSWKFAYECGQRTIAELRAELEKERDVSSHRLSEIRKKLERKL